MRLTFISLLTFCIAGCYSPHMMQTAKPLKKGEHELSTAVSGGVNQYTEFIEPNEVKFYQAYPSIDIMYRTGIFKNADLGLSFAPSGTVGHLRADLKYNFFKNSKENIFVSSILSIEGNNLRYIGSGPNDDFYLASGLGLIASFNHRKNIHPYVYQKFTIGLTGIGVFKEYSNNTPPTDLVRYWHNMFYIGGAGFRYQFENHSRLQLFLDLSYYASRETLYYNYLGFSGNDQVMMLSKWIKRKMNYQLSFGLSFRLDKKSLNIIQR